MSKILRALLFLAVSICPLLGLTGCSNEEAKEIHFGPGPHEETFEQGNVESQKKDNAAAVL